MITPEKCRAARALLNWTQNDLAQAASLGVSTIKLYESGDNNATRESTLKLISTAFFNKGIHFLDNGVVLN